MPGSAGKRLEGDDVSQLFIMFLLPLAIVSVIVLAVLVLCIYIVHTSGNPADLKHVAELIKTWRRKR
jgi:hypothetical protein